MGVRDYGLSPTGIYWDFREIPLSESEIPEIPVTFEVPNTSSHWDSAALVEIVLEILKHLRCADLGSENGTTNTVTAIASRNA